MRRCRRQRFLRAGVALVLLLTAVPLTAVPQAPAEALHAPVELPARAEIGPDGRVFYHIDKNLLDVGFIRENFWRAEQSWKIQGLTQQVEFWNWNSWEQSGYRPANDRQCSGRMRE